jgi:hypothetical protein
MPTAEGVEFGRSSQPAPVSIAHDNTDGGCSWIENGFGSRWDETRSAEGIRIFI